MFVCCMSVVCVCVPVVLCACSTQLLSGLIAVVPAGHSVPMGVLLCLPRSYSLKHAVNGISRSRIGRWALRYSRPPRHSSSESYYVRVCWCTRVVVCVCPCLCMLLCSGIRASAGGCGTLPDGGGDTGRSLGQQLPQPSQWSGFDVGASRRGRDCACVVTGMCAVDCARPCACEHACACACLIAHACMWASTCKFGSATRVNLAV